MNVRPRRLSPYTPESKLDELDPVERLVLRVNSLERWARTLSAQHEEWLGEVGRFAAQLDMVADRLAKFTDDMAGVEAVTNFDNEPPF